MSIKHNVQSLPPPHLLSERLRSFFSGQNGDDFSRLCSVFPAHWEVYILGGLIRNLLLNELRRIHIESADVDIVVKGPRSSTELKSAVQQFCIGQNDFGGAKCRISSRGLLFDVWRIDDHVTISGSQPPHTLQQLLQHNLLDVDAILWDTKTGYLHEYGCLASIKNSCIDLLDEGVSKHFVAAQVAHILIVSFKTGFELSQHAQTFVRRACASVQTKNLVIEVLRRKAETISYELKQFLKELQKGEAHPLRTLTG